MGREVMGAAVGIGPVETLDQALRNALKAECDFISNIKLVDYRVRVVNPENSTFAKVRVFISSSDGKERWDTVGVHENIVEASWTALVDSYEYYYHCVLENEKNPLDALQKKIKTFVDKTTTVASDIAASMSEVTSKTTLAVMENTKSVIGKGKNIKRARANNQTSKKTPPPTKSALKTKKATTQTSRKKTRTKTTKTP